MFAADEASQALGIKLVEAGNGQAVATMEVTSSMVNGHDIAHGGYVFLLADTAFALACNSHGPAPGARAPTSPSSAPGRPAAQPSPRAPRAPPSARTATTRSTGTAEHPE